MAKPKKYHTDTLVRELTQELTGQAPPPGRAGRPKVYTEAVPGAPILHVRLDPEVLAWLKEQRGGARVVIERMVRAVTTEEEQHGAGLAEQLAWARHKIERQQAEIRIYRSKGARLERAERAELEQFRQAAADQKAKRHRAEQWAREATHFDYCEVDGSFVQRVSRLGHGTNKAFRVSPAKPKRTVPLCLPELAGADTTRPILWVEGEKDVATAKGMGLLATTTPLGAYSFHLVDQLSLWVFRGRRVVIIPDNDQPGRDYAEQVHCELTKIGARATILELPTEAKGDLTEWVAAGGTVGQLLELIEQA